MSPNVDDLVDGLLADDPPATTAAPEFLGAQFDRGLAWLHFADAVRRIAGEDGWWEAASALPTLLRDLERQPHVAGPWYSDPDGVAEARFDFEKEGR